MTNFPTLDFGAPAAERDISRGLADYFVESEAYRRVESGRKTIVLGNRGTGKSAIFKVLADREKRRGTIVIELAPEDYSYEMLTRSLGSEASGSWAKLGAYAVAWKYLIMILVMKELNLRVTGRRARDLTDIKRYLRDNVSGVDLSPLDQLIGYLKRLEGIKIGPLDASIKTRELHQMYKLDAIAPLLPSIISLCESVKVYVFVDELDRGWDASEDARAFVAGLFQACTWVNQLSPNLRLYMSLRQELYNNIPELYEDAQKFRDLLEEIAWDETSLLRLAANRIRHSVRELRSAQDQDCWNAVFSETLDYRQTKSFNYIVDRSLYRPREVVQFCSQVVDLAREQHAEFPIDYATISSAEVSYSRGRAQDIAAEYRFQYPGLLQVFEVFRGRTYNLERHDLETLCLEMALGEIPTGDATPWIEGIDPEQLIEVLWRVGFLRAQAVGGVKARRRSGSTYLGSHQIDALNLGTLTRFHVHPMFRAALGMKEAKAAEGRT